MVWYILGYIIIGFLCGSLWWGMFNEVKYSHFYGKWYNTEDAGSVILLSIIWPLTLLGFLIKKVFEWVSNIGYNITH